MTPQSKWLKYIHLRFKKKKKKCQKFYVLGRLMGRVSVGAQNI